MIREVRAAAITVLLIVNGLIAVPLPKSVKRSDLDQPVAEEEITRWVGIAAAFGWDTSQDELKDLVFRHGGRIAAARKSVLAPIKPLLRVTGTGQSWGLFTYPDTFPHRLVIEGRRGEEWETLYAGLDPEHTFLRDVLVYRRVRGVYDGHTIRPGPAWENLTRWAADRAFQRWPDLVEVRVRFLRFHVVPPGGAADPAVVPRHARTFPRP